MSGKIIGIVLVLLILAGGGYYYASMNGGMNVPSISEMRGSNTAQEDAGSSAPAQSGSVEDFTASIDSELQATSVGIGAMDAQTDASVTDIQSTGDSSRLYDPNNL